MNIRFWVSAFILFILCVFAFVMHITTGAANLSINELASSLTEYDSPSSVILWRLRIPRAVYGIILGAGLAVSGLALQGLFRNPLAEPFTLGISGGAGFGAVLAIMLGISSGIGLSVMAMAGAIFVTLFVYSLSQRAVFSQSALILCGVMTGYFFQSALMLLISLSSGNRAHGAMMWLLGDLGSAPAEMMGFTVTWVGIGCALLYRQTKALDILAMGEEKAASLGVNTKRLRRNIFFCASMVTGACVASVGIVGFVGLIIPHVLRTLAGTQHQALFPLCILGGAGFVLLCDLAAKSILSPIELPLGVVTGLIGSLTFLWMFIRKGA